MNDTSFLTGTKIILRPLMRKDINANYLSWLNDEDTSRYLESGTFPLRAHDLEKFYENNQKSKSNVLFAIVAKKGGKHIGNIQLGGINWVHRFANLGILIGAKNYWSKGYGTEACQLLLKYAFDRLNLNKVTLGVYANHEGAIKAYKRVGFKIEGRLKKMFVCEGRYVDKTLMGILKKDYDRLKNNNGSGG